MCLRWFLIVMLAVFTGCGFAEPPAPPPPPRPAPSAPAAPPYADRVKAAMEMAEEAMKVEGTPKGRRVAGQLANCTVAVETCVQLAGTFQSQSKVGSLAGLAVNLAKRVDAGQTPDMNRQFIEEAEKLAKRALDEAGAPAAKQAQADAQKAANAAENEMLKGAIAQCTADLKACKSKCDSGDGVACSVLAAQANQDGKLVEAQALATKGCKLGAQAACRVSEKISAQLNGLWGEVQEVGDDLVVKTYQTTMVAKLGKASTAAKMRTFNAATVAERYCPARKAFVAALGAAEFAKKAAAHCKDEPPTGQGLSGAEVTLTAQCQQVYASACP